jgi:hypothetical protein
MDVQTENDPYLGFRGHCGLKASQPPGARKPEISRGLLPHSGPALGDVQPDPANPLPTGAAHETTPASALSRALPSAELPEPGQARMGRLTGDMGRCGPL